MHAIPLPKSRQICPYKPIACMPSTLASLFWVLIYLNTWHASFAWYNGIFRKDRYLQTQLANYLISCYFGIDPWIILLLTTRKQLYQALQKQLQCQIWRRQLHDWLTLFGASRVVRQWSSFRGLIISTPETTSPIESNFTIAGFWHLPGRARFCLVIPLGIKITAVAWLNEWENSS